MNTYAESIEVHASRFMLFDACHGGGNQFSLSIAHQWVITNDIFHNAVVQL